MRPVRRWLLHPLAALFVVAVLGLAALIWWATAIGPSTASRSGAIERARSVGRQIAINVSSYDYAKVDQQFGVVASELTGPALAQFNADKANIKKYLTTNKVATSSTADADAVVPGASSDRVNVMVALTSAQSVAGKAQSASSLLIQLTLVRSGGDWLAQSVGYVNSNG